MTRTPQFGQSTEHLNPGTLNAFIDGELLPEERRAFERHLTACHSCTLRLLSATQLKSATARAGYRFTPPADALSRLNARLQSQSPADSTKLKSSRMLKMPPIRSMVWSGLAAAILFAVSLLGVRQMHQTSTFAAELLDQHLATLSIAAIPQVISTDRHTVKPWFQGRIPFSFNLPDPTALPADTTLKGADLTYLNNEPSALLLFNIHRHNVSVFLTRKPSSPNLVALPGTRAGFTLRTATTSELLIIAVSDVNPTDLDLLVAALVRAQSPA